MHVQLTLLVCLPLLALAQDIDLTAVAAASFRRIDANHDGHLTRSELENYFTAYDGNNDGRVSRIEYFHYIDATYHDPDANRVLHSLFDDLDFNDDSNLNLLDYNHFFTAADSNNNNQLTQLEYERQFRVLVGPSFG
ncbi:uncharacterized protein LOC131947695 [Physella acuta]|uniref:uncharacterized protein LOC131947695 n=1 Tax=Physella acuta TaxID=109671 RepID=UPI0027DAC2E8|nr:uncharacterized protein LOC131947695 [Physella acuta]XP_059164956.1 uncharacterized protein LOC131947695 [Physella acuta]